MSNIRKLSAFRQLSLNCNSPTPEQRRKTLRKQFSEDLPDIRDSWLDSGIGIKISLNAKTSRNLDRPPPIKIAWEDNSELKSEEAVIIKKCKEVRRGSTGKLSRQTSLEKDSILHSKQELAERLRQVVKEKAQEKPNLKIFLAHNSKEQNDDFYNNQMVGDAEPYLEKAFERPKLIQPLITNNVSNDNKNLFQIRKNFRPKINLAEIAYSPTRSSDSNANISRSNTVVVVPMVEREEVITKHETVDQCNTPIDAKESDDIKPIDSIIIRPSTAASRREKFQKRTNSAFHATVKEPSNARPPLVRSSSAPSKPDHSKQKFLANKRKIKSAKRGHIRSHSHTVEDELDDNNSNKENPKSQKELNRTTAVNGTEVITMVSLVSPAGSDVEEEAVEVNKEKCKSKNNSGGGNKRAAKEEKEVPRNLSLRKTVKSVSFQQSSIHAIRSFSASFPARRGSMATALMLGNNIKPTSHGPKVQEKRSTNSSTPDDDERVPKRRLVRSNTEQPKTISCEQPEHEVQPEFTDDSDKQTSNANFAVDIKSKIVAEAAEPAAPDVASVNQQEPAPENQDQQDEVKPKEETKYESPKEKQCWDMYCKMIDKGISVSFDTILRGMLTPTEYRLSRKNSVVVAEEAPDTC